MSGFGEDIIAKCLEKTWTALITDQHYDFQVSDEKILEKLKYFLPQDTVRLSCTSSSSRPPATLSWILNDQKVINCKLIPKRWWQWWHRILLNILTFDGSGFLRILHSLIHFGLLPTFHCAPSWSFRGRRFMNRKRPFWDLTPSFVCLFPIFQAEKCSFENANFVLLCFAMFMTQKGYFDVWDLTSTFIFVSQ